MDTPDLVAPALGGALFGLATTALMWLHGRVAGFSGICGGLLSFARGDVAWRVALLAGLLVAGVVGARLEPSAFELEVAREPWMIPVAGVLVGLGTRLGNGCTSGHGIAGIARLSRRSLAATATFMGVAALVVLLLGGAS